MSMDTKTAILDAAERVARARGFDGFSYADLAAEVMVSKASIHHHFPSKAALSLALTKRYYDNLETACAEIDREHETGAARLAALVGRYRDALEGGQSLCLCVSFSISRESLSTETIAEMNRFRLMMIDWLGLTFRRGKADGTIRSVDDPLAEAAATLPLLEGAQLSARVAQDPQRFEAATEILVARLNG